jgi:hypothetical protein
LFSVICEILRTISEKNKENQAQIAKSTHFVAAQSICVSIYDSQLDKIGRMGVVIAVFNAKTRQIRVLDKVNSVVYRLMGEF